MLIDCVARVVSRLFVVVLFSAGCCASAEETMLDLASAEAAKAWAFSDRHGRIEQGELVLDGRSMMTSAYYLPSQWDDVAVRAKFLVEPQATGVLACGFVVRAADAATKYYVHYDRTQAILCRSTPQNSWIEIGRVSNLDKPAGQWHDGELRVKGHTLEVLLNGTLLFAKSDPSLARGRIGFYASQGLARVKDIRVSGQAVADASEFRLPPPLFTHVCTDAGAGGYEAFPDVCRLQDGRLMCVFYAGYGHVALPNDQLPRGGRIAYCLSEDEGRTWSGAQTLYDSDDDDRDPSIVQLASGRIICNYFSLRSASGENPPWTGLGTWLVYSDDNGRSWSQPRRVAEDYYCSSPIRQLSDGRLILGLYTEKDTTAWGAVTISEDDGLSWTEPIDIDNGGMRLDAETDVIELSDGRLFAAQRAPEGQSAAWSVSEDGGRTWSRSEPFGFEGHCHYLHRTVDGVIVMAHRLPNTSLRYSFDECCTWSDAVEVDAHIGAYPSMVNLKDGSVLIVYYEEGDGSSIRARRFRVSRAGVEWLPVAAGPLPEATLLSVRRIWDESPHNAFTSLARFNEQWYCAFREGEGHVSNDGALRVIRSTDGARWESVAHITSDTADLRDAQICVTPDHRLMLSGAAALHQPAAVRHQTMAYFSSDGENWSEGIAIGEPNLWLWRVTWHRDRAYGIGYATAVANPDDRFIRLYQSGDGSVFETLVERLREREYSNESSMVFTIDDMCYCLLRRDQSPVPATGLLGIARPPYTQWEWKDLRAQIGGPAMIQIPDGRFVAAVRLYDSKVRTALCWIDPSAGTLREFLTLPSGGDTSYAGLVWHDDQLWVSYYSSHEQKSCIYLARVRFDR